MSIWCLEQLGVIDTMDRLNELLEYVQRTNPDMTKEKLIEELGKSDYSARGLIYIASHIKKQ